MIDNPVTREDFLLYLNEGIKVLPLNNGVSLITKWDSLDWDELPEPHVIVNSWFDTFGDKLNGIGIALGEDHNPQLCCIKMKTTDLEIIEKISIEFKTPYISSNGKTQYLFFKNIHPVVLNKYLYDCPSGGHIKVMYRSHVIPLPPSYHSKHTLYHWADDAFGDLRQCKIDDLPTIVHNQMLLIGQLINSPTTATLNLNLPQDEQFNGRLEREQKMEIFLERIYAKNPHNPLEDTITQALDFDALNNPTSSLFLGGNNKASTREANAPIYVAEFNQRFSMETSFGATFNNQIESDHIVFSPLIPIEEAHSSFDNTKLPDFDEGLIPNIWRPMIKQICPSEGVPLQSLFMTMFTGLGACAQGNTVIRPQPMGAYFRRTCLATALVASSGSRKSDIIRIGIKELEKIQKTLSQSNSRDDLMRIMDGEKKIEMLTREKGKTGADIEAINVEIKKVEDELNENPLKGTEFVYGNATVQKMILDASRNQKHGLIMVKDEMKQIVAEMKKKGNEDMRSFYMQGFDGNGSYSYLTKIGGKQFIEKHILSCITSVQPSVVSVYINGLYSAHSDGNDGFYQRFIMVPFGDPQIGTADDVDYSKFVQAYEVFNKAFYHDDIEINVAPEAMATYKKYLDEINREKIMASSNDPLASVLAKHQGFLSSFAAIYGLLMDEGVPTKITVEHLDMAIKLLRYLRSCAKFLFEVKDKQETSEALNNVAKMVCNKHFRNGGTQSEWFQSLRGLYKQPVTFYNALKELEMRGYVRLRINKSNSVSVFVNPEVFMLRGGR